MKKPLLLILVVLFTLYESYGQTYSLPFVEDFEAVTFPPDGWTSFIGANGLGDIENWVRWFGTSDNNNGSAGSANVRYENVGVGLAEDWLVTPAIILPPTGSSTLMFYQKQLFVPDYGSNYYIKISTTSQIDPTAFSDVETYGELSFSDSYTVKTVDLSAYNGQTVYIAFVMTNNDGDSWFVDDITIYNADNAWTGALGSDWNTAGNWDPASVPTSSDNVIVPAGPPNYPTLSAAGACNDLTIISTASSTGSLVGQENLTVNGTTTAYQYLSGNAWHLISSPAPGEALSTFLSTNTNIPVKDVSGTNRMGMMDYDETVNNWNEFFLETGQAGNLDEGKGFSLRTTADGTVIYTGTLATGTVSTTVANSGTYGWNSVGNPYPSAININSNADATNNFISNNSSNLDASFAAVYVWEQGSKAYTIVTQSDAAYYAQSGQAFMVKVNPGVTAVDFTLAMQTHQPSVVIKSENLPWPELELTLTQVEKSASTKIKFNDEMSTGLDVGYDAGIFKTGFDIYTRLVDDNSVDFGVQCLPEMGMEEFEIPVGIDGGTSGEISFSLKSVNLASGIVPVLNDHLTGESFVFNSEEDVYTTSITDQSQGYGRFTLTFSSTTGIDNNSVSTLKAWYNKGYIYINGQLDGAGEATIYDINGRKLAEHPLTDSFQNKISAPEGTGSIYLVKIKDSKRSEVLKVPVVIR